MDYLSACNAQAGLEFIARLTSHIPDKGQVMIRYYGLCSNAHRCKKRKKAKDSAHPPIIEEDTSPSSTPAPPAGTSDGSRGEMGVLAVDTAFLSVILSSKDVIVRK